MKKQIERMVDNFPIGGMALHGTTYEKALRMKNEGLIENEGLPPYTTPLPHPSMQNGKRNVSEILHRTIGSISLSAKYGGPKGRKWSDPTLTEKQMPAIVIFGKFKWPRREGYDSNFLVGRQKAVGERARHHRTFGKTPGAIKPENVEKIVRITKKEQEKILGTIESGQRQNSAMQALLMKKTLRAIRGLVEEKDK